MFAAAQNSEVLPKKIAFCNERNSRCVVLYLSLLATLAGFAVASGLWRRPAYP
jgi:hypothetical protein